MKDVALLIIRLTFGGTLLFAHGLEKLMHFSEKSATFPDPFGVGHAASLVLIIFAEVFCAAAVSLGLFTRMASFIAFFGMFIAVTKIHGAVAWSEKEHAFLFAMAFLSLVFGGPGKISFDWFLRRQFGSIFAFKRKRRASLA